MVNSWPWYILVQTALCCFTLSCGCSKALSRPANQAGTDHKTVALWHPLLVSHQQDYPLRRRSVTADTVLSISFNILTSRKLKELHKDIARTCSVQQHLFPLPAPKSRQLAGLRVRQCHSWRCLKSGSCHEISYLFDGSALSLASEKGVGGPQKSWSESVLIWIACKSYFGKNWWMFRQLLVKKEWPFLAKLFL